MEGERELAEMTLMRVRQRENCVLACTRTFLDIHGQSELVQCSLPEVQVS